MVTKKELEEEVARFNKKYCAKTRNKLKIGWAYGGCQIQLTGKESPKTGKLIGLKSGAANITNGFLSKKDTLNALYKAESNGWLKSTIKQYEPKKGGRKK